MEEEGDDLDERLGIQNTKNINNENNGNFNRALQKAAGHMENTFVAAFAGIILGVVLLRDHVTYAKQIQVLLPDKCFDTLAFILKKFFFFLRMSVSIDWLILWKIYLIMFVIRSMRLHLQELKHSKK